MSLDAAAKDIKIPANHYIGFQARGVDDVPLGFMTPDGTDKAAQKRKDTVDSWSRQGTTRWNPVTMAHEAVKKIEPASYENKPLSGFKLGREIRRHSSWGQGNVKWRIEDPRGFELEISSPNFASIILCTTIENGDILEECVWARQGSENILLPVSSEVYKTAIANTSRINASISLKDLQPGHHVVLQNGNEGLYLGQHFCFEDHGIRHRSTDENDRSPLTGWGDKKRHFIAQLKDGEIASIECLASIKPSAATDSDIGKLTPQEAEARINDFLVSDAKSISTAGNSYGYVRAVTCEKPVAGSAKYEYQTRTFDELVAHYKPGKHPYGHAKHYIGYEVGKRVTVVVEQFKDGVRYINVDPHSMVTNALTYRDAKAAGTFASPISTGWGGHPGTVRFKGTQERAMYFNQLDQDRAKNAEIISLGNSQYGARDRGWGYGPTVTDYEDQKYFFDLERLENGTCEIREIQVTLKVGNDREIQFFL